MILKEEDPASVWVLVPWELIAFIALKLQGVRCTSKKVSAELRRNGGFFSYFHVVGHQKVILEPYIFSIQPKSHVHFCGQTNGRFCWLIIWSPANYHGFDYGF